MSSAASATKSNTGTPQKERVQFKTVDGKVVRPMKNPPFKEMKPGMLIFLDKSAPGAVWAEMDITGEYLNNTLTGGKGEGKRIGGGHSYYYIVYGVGDRGISIVSTSSFDSADAGNLESRVDKWHECPPIYPMERLEGQLSINATKRSEDPKRGIQLKYEGKLVEKGGWIVPSRVINVPPELFSEDGQISTKDMRYFVFPTELDEEELQRVKNIASRNDTIVGAYVTKKKNKKKSDGSLKRSQEYDGGSRRGKRSKRQR